MNNDHIYGRLRKMKIGRDLEGTKTKTLIIRPRKTATKTPRSPRAEQKSEKTTKTTEQDGVVTEEL